MAEAPDLVGMRVDRRYDVTEKLFSGFYGTCWKAYDEHTKDIVCIKTFFVENKDQIKELTILKEFVDGHFEHDNLCRVLNVSLKKASVMSALSFPQLSLRYVTFEFCSGTDLFNFLITGPYEREGKANPFSESLSCHFYVQILLAVMYLHERGVYHRDIKPENCVLDDNFNLKLTDFGTNKIIRQHQMAKVVRTSTHNIGTDCYRAPEVSGHEAYDPCFADIWSMGITLFFLVGIDRMVDKCKALDHYMRRLLAPLGILFPFPVHCSKLDSYLRNEEDIRVRYEFEGSLQKKPLQNDLFWSEWIELKTRFSRDLLDLFNRIFILPSQLRITLSDMIRHPWVQKNHRMTQKQVYLQMEERRPKSVKMNPKATPKVFPSILHSGRDQASLRRSLSFGDSTRYLPDGEVWEYSPDVKNMILHHCDLIAADVHASMHQLGLCQNIISKILQSTLTVTYKTVQLESQHIHKFLEALHFKAVPNSKGMLLSPKDVDRRLLGVTLDLIKGVEEALKQGLFVQGEDIQCDQDEEMPTPTPSDPTPASIPYLTLMDHSDPSRTDSGHGTLPDIMNLVERLENLRDEQTLLLVNMEVNIGSDKTVGLYTAAHEFCRVSGLLCSYGISQTVREESLTVFCKSDGSAFGIQVVVCNSDGLLGLVSWCYHGYEVWEKTIKRLVKDLGCSFS